jgi:pimeloyl-ACP methyl ester carboxylesterase
MKKFAHHRADVNGIRMHYVIGGTGDPVLLIHGFPQTWYEWRHIMPALADRFTVIAPDYRGAGHTSRPVSGYDKRTMAEDMHELVQSLGFGKTAIVGHDIGLMIAYAYAAAFREETSRLVVMDSGLPGTQCFDIISQDPRVWHFGFHGVRDLPEMLVAGRERRYLQYFFQDPARLYNSDAFHEHDIVEFVNAYSAPGALRAGFELYRAFAVDADYNRHTIPDKLAMPVLAMGGQYSTSGPHVENMMREVALDVRGVRVPNAAHWLAEENPAFVIEELLKFF